jgi:hypothetical protein
MEGLIANNAGGFGFSARPQVIQGNSMPYRDPYREYVYTYILDLTAK